MVFLWVHDVLFVIQPTRTPTLYIVHYESYLLYLCAYAISYPM